MSSPNKFVSIDTRSNERDATDDYFVGEYHHLPASRQRKQNLLTYAQHNTKADNIRLNLSDTADTASIQNREDDNGPVIITIPTGLDVDNPYVSLDDDEFYSMLQYAWVLHETGHYLYTDQPTVNERFEAFQDTFDDFPRRVQGMLTQLGQHLWNAIEDGAMEEAIRNEKGPKAGQRLAVKNESFISQPAKEFDIEKTQQLDVFGATQTAAMDLAKYDTGSLRRLLDETDDSWQFQTDDDRKFFVDEILPTLHQGIADAFTAPSSVKRQHVIWDVCEDVVAQIVDHKDIDPEQEPDMPFEQDSNDTENESGAAKKQQSPGLQQNTKQQVAQRQANTTQQTVSIQTDDGSESESSDGDDGNDDTEQETDSGSSNNDHQDSGDDTSNNTNDHSDGSSDGSEGQQSQHGTTGSSDADDEITCPDCGSTDVSREVQTVDGMIAARVNAPFQLDAAWIDSIRFVWNDDVCGFRIQTAGDVPTEHIESQGYIVATVDTNTVEVLERADQYSDKEDVNGFHCDACGNTWVPVIGGDTT